VIISHKHRFIFIKTEKTAGTSVEIALSRICGPNDIITPISPEDEKIREELHYRGPQNYRIPFFKYDKEDLLKSVATCRRRIFFNHISASKIIKYIGRNMWDKYYTFCFERNPWDKVISYYYWLKDQDETLWDFIQKGRAGKIRGFELYTIGGIPIVDKIYKYEELEEAINDIQKRLGLQDSINLPNKKAKSSVRKDKRQYSDILGEKEKDYISKIFAREIKYLNYSF